MFKVNNKDNDLFIVKSEHISHLVLVFLLLTLSRKMPAGTFVILQRLVFVDNQHNEKERKKMFYDMQTGNSFLSISKNAI